ncbi:MAG: hypothetical protein GX096_03490 [Clostridiales bacterium]|nr:hypothetical protein [Clostridiales bacterium]
MKKTWILLVISILCMGLFSSCASNADVMPSPLPTVSMMPSANPATTMPPVATVMPTTIMPTTEAGINSIEDSLRVSDKISEEVEKLSELKTAVAVAAGNMVIIGVDYDTKYQGGLTDRMMQMIDQRVQTVDKAITVVRVTEEKAEMDKIKALKEKVDSKDITFTELQTQVADIGSTIAGGSNMDMEMPQTTTGV